MDEMEANVATDAVDCIYSDDAATAPTPTRTATPAAAAATAPASAGCLASSQQPGCI